MADGTWKWRFKFVKFTLLSWVKNAVSDWFFGCVALLVDPPKICPDFLWATLRPESISETSIPYHPITFWGFEMNGVVWALTLDTQSRRLVHVGSRWFILKEHWNKGLQWFMAPVYWRPTFWSGLYHCTTMVFRWHMVTLRKITIPCHSASPRGLGRE